jgi:hypothetical protein
VESLIVPTMPLKIFLAREEFAIFLARWYQALIRSARIQLVFFVNVPLEMRWGIACELTVAVRALPVSVVRRPVLARCSSALTIDSSGRLEVLL